MEKEFSKFHNLGNKSIVIMGCGKMVKSMEKEFKKLLNINMKEHFSKILSMAKAFKHSNKQ
jgi:hypothetical protein